MRDSIYTGKKIRIISLSDPWDSTYPGREGIVEFVDDMGQLHGTWGGLAVIPGEDSFEVISD